ncbi:MAG: hypothetical protein RL107_258, partial [Actinomycetota bacterium]
GKGGQFLDQHLCCRAPHLAHRSAQGYSVGQIVDVFACTREMRQFGDAGQPKAFEVFSDEEFDGFDVVMRRCFELGNASDIGITEVRRDIAQGDALAVTQRRTKEALVREADQPLDFDMNPRTVEPRFGQVLTNLGNRTVVATIQRTERLGRKGHDSILTVLSPRDVCAPPFHEHLVVMPFGSTIVHTVMVIFTNLVSATDLLGEAIADLERSIARTGWVGPARIAYDDVATEFRSRLISLAIQTRSTG